MGAEEGEGVMTLTTLARSILGPIIQQVLGVVTISDPPPERQSGTPHITLWPPLSPVQRAEVKKRLCDLDLRMRRCRFSYYGRPEGLPYTTETEFGVTLHTFCTTRAEWDESRIQALRVVAPTLGVDEPRRLALEQVQRETMCDDRPVLTHGDLSERKSSLTLTHSK
ncbi:hypothetical protein EVJ58_g10299 [Rhodofomes roseus]|uniref:Uncharacterized protein n=1 Tax=Rhodofomes roseus TaxID=34475 RepID=A0A4Y9XP99_9APHY|nr:hypothetical protein EVJ58_g10299 [Rhodofomes roseus]